MWHCSNNGQIITLHGSFNVIQQIRKAVCNVLSTLCMMIVNKLITRNARVGWGNLSRLMKFSSCHVPIIQLFSFLFASKHCRS